MKTNSSSLPFINCHFSLRNVYHHAGQVAAIHFNNKHNQLPPVHFQLVTKFDGLRKEHFADRVNFRSKHRLKLEGGRLLEDLPFSFESATRQLSSFHQRQCQLAFEADMINLMVGPLAEAKFVAQRDGEPFNAKLISLDALRFYGGIFVLETLKDYLTCLLPDQPKEQQAKLVEVFSAAFRFVDNPMHWFAISYLANTIINGRQTIFPCEELIHLLEMAISVNSGPGSNFKIPSKALLATL